MWLDPALVLPPLKMSDPTPTTNTVAVSHSSTNLMNDLETLSPTPVSTEITVSSMPAPVANPNPSPDILPAPNDQNPGTVTPEVLMRYFNKRGQEVLVSPPVQFVPPPPSTGSSATYTSE